LPLEPPYQPSIHSEHSFDLSIVDISNNYNFEAFVMSSTNTSENH
jgi:hypothetical protein